MRAKNERMHRWRVAGMQGGRHPTRGPRRHALPFARGGGGGHPANSGPALADLLEYSLSPTEMLPRRHVHLILLSHTTDQTCTLSI